MSTPIVKVGIIGAGEISQTTHLPTLQLLSHLFKVTAICDLSQKAVFHCRDKFGIVEAYTDSYDLVNSANVDLVLIASADEYHASLAVSAIRAGKHVLIEKPIALTRRDAQAIIDASKEHPKQIVAVGYMRRYAAGLTLMKKILSEAGKINYVHVRDIIGANSTFVSQSGTYPIKTTDFPAGSFEEKQDLAADMVKTSIGVDNAKDPRLVRTWRLLNGLSSHDISALRDLVGPPKSVKFASSSLNVTFLHACLEYDGFDCIFETGVDNVASFDASIEVFTERQRIKLSYDTPYIKGLPVFVSVKGQDKDGVYSESTIRATYEDPYTSEFLAVYKAIVEGSPVRTPPEDALLDLQIFEQIIDRLGSSLASSLSNGH